MSAGTVGKRFEREVLNALRAKYPDWLVERFTDKMYKSGLSQPSPPDIIVVGDNRSVMIECKVVKGVSIPFSRLADHQQSYLRRHSALASGESYLALLFYNGRRGKSRMLRCFFVPFDYWQKREFTGARKSLSLRECEADLGGFAGEWVKGEWKLPDSL